MKNLCMGIQLNIYIYICTLKLKLISLFLLNKIWINVVSFKISCVQIEFSAITGLEQAFNVDKNIMHQKKYEKYVPFKITNSAYKVLRY